MDRAKRLLEDYDGCVHSPSYPGFDYLTEKEVCDLELRRNQENVSYYYELSNQLVQLCHDKSLHWRHTELSQSLLSLLLRRDIEYPKAAILIFARLLASDTIRTRKTAINIMSSYLKINKPKAVRQLFEFDKASHILKSYIMNLLLFRVKTSQELNGQSSMEFVKTMLDYFSSPKTRLHQKINGTTLRSTQSRTLDFTFGPKNIVVMRLQLFKSM